MRRRFLLSTAAADLVALVVAAGLASLFVFSTPFPWLAEPGIWPMLGFLGAGWALGSWTSARMWARSVPRPSYGRALTIVLLGLGVSSLSLVVTRVYWSRAFLGLTMAFWLGGALAHRVVRRRRPWTEQMVLITQEKGLADDLRNAPHADVLAVFDPATDSEILPLEPGTTLAVDLRAVLSDRMAQFASSSNLAGYDVRAMGSLYEEHTGRLPIVHLTEGWELSTPVLRTAPFLPGKRLVDTLLVLVTAPLTLLAAGMISIAVRLSSSGPVIFRQRRVGWQGKEFTLYKFRTMREDAEAAGPQFARAGDGRLTGVGRFLRRFRADEIPQLWNVLRGDLSMVGPRPEQVPFATRFAEEIPFYSHRHLVRPGVTGWAQVNYGYADDQADTIEKLTYDLYYVKNMSPWLDLHVLGRSVWTVLSGFGAQ